MTCAVGSLTRIVTLHRESTDRFSSDVLRNEGVSTGQLLRDTSLACWYRKKTVPWHRSMGSGGITKSGVEGRRDKARRSHVDACAVRRRAPLFFPRHEVHRPDTFEVAHIVHCGVLSQLEEVKF